MRRTIRQLVPSMFHRRLWLLMLTALAISAVLAYQLARLTLVQGATLRGEADKALVEGTPIPTARGRILDRKMRVLAQDRPSYDIAVQYPVISGEWAYEAASQAAYQAARRSVPNPWTEGDYDEQQKAIAKFQPDYDMQVNSLLTTLCILGKVSRLELEQRMADIKSRVQEVSGSLMVRRWTTENKRRIAEQKDPIGLWEAAQNIEEQRSSHVLLTGVSGETALKVQRLIALAEHAKSTEVWSEVSVEPSRERDYPSETMSLSIDRSSFPTPLRSDEPVKMNVEGVAMHVVGLMRDVWKEDPRPRPAATIGSDGKTVIDLRSYQPGDQIGSFGVERQLEDTLRGARGLETRHLDKDTREQIDPVAGDDAVLTIDAQLQARIQAVMDPAMGLMKVQPWQPHDPTANAAKPHKPELGESLNGAAVVLDVATGEVLAAVSEPSLTLRELREMPGAVWHDQMNMPFLNRAVSQAYQPGSTVKPLVLAAAVTDRKLGYDETVTCNGHFYPNDPNHYRCWIYKMGMALGVVRTHGPLTGPQAIEQSCNIFFMTMGQRFGLDRLTWWYQRYGLGQATGCGFGEEVKGSLPAAGGESTPEDALYLGMGQGPILWTPLQAATAYATLARGGHPIAPTFIRQPEQGGRQGVDLQLDPKGVEMALEGMYLAANSPVLGTSSHLTILGVREPVFNLPGVKVMAKSGTADAAPLRVDSDHDGRITSKDEIVREGDHAWSVVLVQKPGSARPDYVVVVIVEFGGSGGNVAAPVANQILHAMRQEGYL